MQLERAARKKQKRTRRQRERERQEQTGQNPGTLSRNERLRELQAAVEGQVQLKRYYLSVHQNQERQRLEIDRLRTNAAKILADADRIQDAIDHWQERYLAADARIAELREKLSAVEHERELARLEELVALVAELSEPAGECDE